MKRAVPLWMTLFAACGGAGSGLQGQQSFSVARAWMDPSQPAQELGDDVLADGRLAATAVDLVEASPSGSGCPLPATTASGRFVTLELATTEYLQRRGGSAALTQPLQPGTFVIGGEGVPDEDLGMLPAGAAAFLYMGALQGGQAQTTWIASGTLTVDNVTSTSIRGSFSVALSDPSGAGASGGNLNGTFDAATCP